MALPVAAEGERNPPPLRINPQHVLEAVGCLDRPAAERDDLVVVAEAAAVGIGRFEDVADDHAAVLVEGHRRPQGRMIDDSAALQVAEEVLHLVDRDRIARPHVDAAPLFERTPADNADQPACGVKQRPARVARINRGVGLDAVGVLQERARGELVAVDPGDHAVGHGRLKIGGQQEGISHHVGPVADRHRVAVAHRRGREIVAAKELDERHVAHRVHPDNHRVVNPAVGKAAEHRLPARPGDVEIRQRVAVRRDDHAGAASLPFRGKDRHDRPLGPLDDGNPVGLGLKDR